jgi:hypothetical protein
VSDGDFCIGQTRSVFPTQQQRNRGSSPGRRNRFFSSPKHPDRRWYPPSLLFNGYLEGGGLFLWIKQPMREAANSSPSTAEIKTKCINNSAPPYTFTTCTGTNLTLPTLKINHRNSQ